MFKFRAIFYASAITAIGGLSFAGQANAADVLFKDVSYLSFEGGVHFEAGDVLTEGDRIVAVGVVDSAAAEGAIVVDGTGRFLIPGLAEMHGHIPSMSGPAEDRNDVLFLYVARGVTIVRGMLGAEGQLDLKRQISEGEITGPTLYLAGPSFNGNSVSSPEQAIEMVNTQVAEGWDLLKIHPGLTLAEYEAMATTANAAGIPFAGHVPEDVGIETALSFGQRTVDHLDGYLNLLTPDDEPLTDEDLAIAIRMTREAGAGQVATQALWVRLFGVGDGDILAESEEVRYMPTRVVDGWVSRFADLAASVEENRDSTMQMLANRDRLLRAFSQAGVEILMGSDAPQLFSVPGFSIIREASAMVDAGMTTKAVLEAATRAPGRYFASEDSFGEIKAGMRADLVLLDADPIAEIAALGQQAGVMAQGNWLSGAEIEARLEAIAARHGN